MKNNIKFKDYETMFTRSELTVLHYLANGYDTVEKISEAMGVSQTSVYGHVKSLKEKGVLENHRGISINHDAFSIRLMNIMKPSKGRAKVLADSGLEILMELREPSEIEEIVADSGLSRATVFRRLGVATSVGTVVKMEDGRYVLNRKMWHGLQELLDSMEDRNDVLDPRVEYGSEIYRNTKEEVLYSSLYPQTDQVTAFSAFDRYGFIAYYNTTYYTTSDQEIDITKAFNDAFQVTEVTNDYRLRLILILFYIKNGDRILADPKFIDFYRRIESGEKILHWPTASDIRSRIEEGVA